MNIISISYKTTPVNIRELFAFSKEEQEEFLKLVQRQGQIKEIVLVSTCNRTEIYFSGDSKVIPVMEQLLSDFKQAALEDVRKYLLVYNGERAIRHLFQVTCGMDSMVLGEDEILGQMREAYEKALGLGSTGYLLNTLFQAAIACAKQIKTDTKLSKTPISIGTLVANEIFRFPKEGKKVLIIGLTGKMGTIIMKNIYCRQKIEIIGTSRSHNSREEYSANYEKVTMVDYKMRYQYMDEADVIISATTSPHYTVTFHELADNLHTRKERLFIDLSVPMDIDEDITGINKVKLYNIDYFKEASKHNSLRKEEEADRAGSILEEHLEETKKELCFHDFLPDLPRVREVFEKHTFEKLLYELRDKASQEELFVLLDLYRRLI